MIRRLWSWLTRWRRGAPDYSLDDGLKQPEQDRGPSPAEIVHRYFADAVDRHGEHPAATAQPVPKPASVVSVRIDVAPRRWNLRDLERLTREHAGADVAQDENRQFLLVYLREFADSNGVLPIDFDGVVRGSFSVWGA
jgi:hypothetical protein